MRTEDPVEKAALIALKSQMSEKIAAIQKGHWEGGDFSILLTDELVKDKVLVANIERFVSEFPREWSMLAVQAKRKITEWAKTSSKQLAHKYFQTHTQSRNRLRWHPRHKPRRWRLCC